MVDKKLLLRVRKATHAGFGDCVKAVEASEGDFEKAVEWLKKQGVIKGSKFVDREADEGGIWTASSSSGIVFIELNSQTDFTARSEPFQALAASITQIILEQQESSYESILNLKIKGDTIKDLCLQLSSVTGEKIVLSRAFYLPVKPASEVGGVYRHQNGLLAAAAILNGSDPDNARKVAVHVAANISTLSAGGIAKLSSQRCFFDESQQMDSFLKSQSSSVQNFFFMEKGGDLETR